MALPTETEWACRKWYPSLPFSFPTVMTVPYVESRFQLLSTPASNLRHKSHSEDSQTRPSLLCEFKVVEYWNLGNVYDQCKDDCPRERSEHGE